MIWLVMLISDSNYISTSFPASSLIRSPGCNPHVLSDRPSSSHSHTSNHLIRSFALIYFHFKRSFILTSSKVLVKLTISSSNLALISNIISLFTLSHDIILILFTCLQFCPSHQFPSPASVARLFVDSHRQLWGKSDQGRRAGADWQESAGGSGEASEAHLTGGPLSVLETRLPHKHLLGWWVWGKIIIWEEPGVEIIQ